MKLVLEVIDSKASLLFELLQNISFVKEVKELDEREITNPVILKGIEDYEINKIQPTPCNMEDLKALLHA